MNIPVYREIDYPESDGKPIAETPIHMQVMWDVINVLIAWFAKRRVYVWGNMFLYYVLGDPRKSVSPDVMVIKGVNQARKRRTIKVWEENNRTPSVTIEITSRKTRREDTVPKFALYQDVLKVREYFLFDPFAEYLDPPLKGYRLRNGVYQPISAVDGRLPSRELGLHLEAHGEELRLWHPATGQWLPTQKEALQRVEEARQRAEAELQEAEVARQLAQAETERLRAELAAMQARLRNGKPPSKDAPNA
jgi:Uma2 family endonuclease